MAPQKKRDWGYIPATKPIKKSVVRRLSWMETQIVTYGRHHPDCPAAKRSGWECICGWRGVLREIQSLGRGQK